VTARRAIVVIAAAALALVSVVVARRTSGERVAAAVGARPSAVAGAADAVLPVLHAGPAPDVASLTTGWLNTAPLTPADLAGKVVLYDLWTFGCVNCQHTIPSLRSWWQRYAGDGLVIVGVHSPEFAYEADPANVARAVGDQGIAYPVALDPDNRDKGYILGRLFAVYEHVQSAALGPRVNATVKDKFYASASAQPRKVFALLEHGSANHLSKVGKASPGRKVNLEKQVGAIMDLMDPADDPFPAALSAEQQALFGLGYYHQRNDFFRSKSQDAPAAEDNAQ